MADISDRPGEGDVVMLDAAPTLTPRRSPGRKETFADPQPIERSHSTVDDATIIRIKSEGLSNGFARIPGFLEYFLAARR